VKEKIDKTYLLLASIFIAALVVCNLIANKFVSVDLTWLGLKTFTISAGVLPYPVTFLITDLLSELYGKKKTSQVVYTGFAASIFVLSVLWLGNQFPAIDGSIVSSEEYAKMFGNSWRVVIASMSAFLVAQLIDVKVYHFWKDLTKGKHLWLRNNGSTIISQLFDTILVVGVLFVGVKSNSEIYKMVVDGWQFKILCAFIDTPLIYLFVWLLRKQFKLKPGEELYDEEVKS
jgi:uncharacterized integral membrane protein (TIGR00697 family)